MPASPKLPPDPEDDIAKLPPIDGGTADELADEAADELDLEIDDDDDPSLDDSTGEGDPPDRAGADVDDIDDEASWLGDEAAQETELELSDSDLAVLADDPSPNLGVGLDRDEASGDDADDLLDPLEDVGLDAGEEGPLAPDDDIREDDLPALDADGDGELDDSVFMDRRFSAEEPSGLPWSERPWTRVGPAFDVPPVTALACVRRGTLVALESPSLGLELMRVDLEGATEPLRAVGVEGHSVLALSASADRIVVLLSGGQLVQSTDGGERFEPLPLGASGPPESRVAADVIASAHGTIALSAAGTLLWSGEDEGTLRPVDAAWPGRIAAIAGPERRALVVDAANLVLGIAVPGTRASDPFGFERAAGPSVRSPALFAARGGHLAYVASSGVARRRAGESWRTFDWPGRITAIAFADDAGTLLAATYSELDDASVLVRLDPDGRAVLVARVGVTGRHESADSDAPRDGRVAVIALDESRGVVWLAGGFGLTALAIG